MATGMAMALVCVGSVTFLLFVLVALIREATSGPLSTVKSLLTKFIPPRKRGELIVMTYPEKERPVKNPSKIALVVLAVLGLSLTASDQKALMEPSAGRNCKWLCYASGNQQRKSPIVVHGGVRLGLDGAG
jgi:hypothetical protein